MTDLNQLQSDITVYRKDYQPPAFWIDSVTLSIDLEPSKTRVLNKMQIRRNLHVPSQALRLDGEDLNLVRVLVNGNAASFKHENEQLVLTNLPEDENAFDVEIYTICQPDKNTSLSGLYVSENTFFTQCEAQGFRRISYFLDRPDVMSIYTVTLRADKKDYPVLLSNGNKIEAGDLENNRHFACFHDPFPKPCYLFALVAGNLVSREQRIRSRDGRSHLLQIYVRPGDLQKTEHAMRSLIASIAWDETRWGLHLDLDDFIIVATSDFNMGAMENKGLNIFNTKYVLANQSTATDQDFSNIESVVGHEYFHNWTGNRITCRDWFQLSLKEGLTVFRDQEFSADMAGSNSARAVNRIQDVRLLRTSQFSEDAGPMAHPVRPDSYQEINNFYTVTVYEKGAEVVRMMHTLVGEAGFRKGLDLYFERFDGQAVTCDDFAQSIADANPNSELAIHLTAFKRWYSQAGTPRVIAQTAYNEQQQTFSLTFTQSAPENTALNESTQPILPFVIPIRMGLLDSQGNAINLQLEGEDTSANTLERILVLHDTTQTFTFVNLPQPAATSLLRNFSAPIILQQDDSDNILEGLLRHDSDTFNQWEAAQKWALRLMLSALKEITLDDIFQTESFQRFIAALRSILNHPTLDAGFKNLILTLPSEAYLAEQLNVVDPQRIHQIHQSFLLKLAHNLHDDWARHYQTLREETSAYTPDAKSAGCRALAATCLLMLCLQAKESGNKIWPGKALQSFKDASNMTDRMAAITALLHAQHPLAEQVVTRFYQLFSDDALVLDKWFSLQAAAPDLDGHILGKVQDLLQHPNFSLTNPNRARSLIFAYTISNPAAFHRHDGAGYQFWSQQLIALDAINPQTAARLARAMDGWTKLAPAYQISAKTALQQVAQQKNLSKDVREIIEKSLAQKVTYDITEQPTTHESGEI